MYTVVILVVILILVVLGIFIYTNQQPPKTNTVYVTTDTSYLPYWSYYGGYGGRRSGHDRSEHGGRHH